MNIFDFYNSSLKTRKRIAVVGDILLDQYLLGSITKISPEHPIPILHCHHDDEVIHKLGGAGNTACQFKNFNFNVDLYGVADAEMVSDIAEDVNFCGIESNYYRNPIKTRFYAQGRPVFRWDTEEVFIDSREILEVVNKLNKEEYDYYVFCDYDKGLFNHHLEKYDLRKAIVDPKIKRDWKYCNVFKPNYKEACELSGTRDPVKQCDYFLYELKCSSVVITCSGGGYYGKWSGGFFDYQDKTGSKYFVEPVGGGDAFSAHLAMGLSHDLDLPIACRLAFEAGKIYVHKGFNEPILPDELLKAFDPIQSKYYLPNNINRKKVVFTNGCFDLGLTTGHIEYLKHAKSLGDILVVALNSDASIIRNKGCNRPYVTLEKRKLAVASLQFVDYVVDFDQDTPIDLIRKIKPSLIVKGGDYRKEDVVGNGEFEVVITPLFDSFSTSDKAKLIF